MSVIRSQHCSGKGWRLEAGGVVDVSNTRTVEEKMEAGGRVDDQECASEL